MFRRLDPKNPKGTNDGTVYTMVPLQDRIVRFDFTDLAQTRQSSRQSPLKIDLHTLPAPCLQTPMELADIAWSFPKGRRVISLFLKQESPI